VKIFEVAWPFEPVTSVSVVAVANRPLAPEAGAVKVTDTPLTGLPPFVTVATNGSVNAVLTVALCPPPLVAVRISVEPEVLVKAKLTDFGPDVAITL
jgi:hypothetical protein